MIKTLLSKLGIEQISPFLIACIVLSSLLSGSVYLMHSANKEVTRLTSEMGKLDEYVDELNETIDDMTIELRERPKEYIEITKTVYQDLCYGEILGESVLSLPSMLVTAKPETEQSIGAKDEKAGYVDIDSKLPPNLLRMLQ